MNSTPLCPIRNPDDDGGVEEEARPPERGLIAAIVERSYRDLFGQEYHEFVESYRWFTSKITGTSLFYTYLHCAEILDFSEKERAFIEAAVAKNKCYLNCPNKFKRDRLGNEKPPEALPQTPHSHKKDIPQPPRTKWKRGYSVCSANHTFKKEESIAA